MARFEGSRGRQSRDSSPRSNSRDRGSFREGNDSRRDSGNRGSFGSSSRGRDSRGGNYSRRDSGRAPGGYGREKREVEMTKVICSECGTECEVPFKPNPTKPVYCNDCFAKKGKSSSDKSFSKDFDMINEKLDKIMKALEIE